VDVPVFSQAGFTAEVVREIDHLVIGVGGLIRELLAFTAGASTVKDSSGQRLSAADVLADRLLRESLVRLVPGSAGYSEEGGRFGATREAATVRWQVDPLDGTRPATLGGAYAVSVGALIVHEGEPVGALGWVYVPALSALYQGAITAGWSDCRLNGRPVEAEALEPQDLATRYVAVGSDWHGLRTAHLPMKLSAPGATAVHLTQLVHPLSDVGAAVLSRYRAYDAAGGIPVAIAGGCALYALDRQGLPGAEPLDPLRFLLEQDVAPGRMGPATLVCRPSVAAAFR
jgi:fructose-1,6-bisphosphatase/inositol monophosphatase family enzyme